VEGGSRERLARRTLEEKRKGWLSCAKREACIRRLCSTVVYDYLLTAVSSVSPPSLCQRYQPTVASIYVRGSLYGALFIWPSPGCLRNHPGSLRRGAKARYLRRELRSHNSGRQTGKSPRSLRSRPRLDPDFPQASGPASTFLAISLERFKDKVLLCLSPPSPPPALPPTAVSVVHDFGARGGSEGDGEGEGGGPRLGRNFFYPRHPSPGRARRRRTAVVDPRSFSLLRLSRLPGRTK